MTKDHSRELRKTSGLINLLVIDGIQIRTNLTLEDLEDPRLWSLRTPEAWARAIYHGRFGIG